MTFVHFKVLAVAMTLSTSFLGGAEEYKPAKVEKKLQSEPAKKNDIAVDCPVEKQPVPMIPRAQTYKGLPFSAGEESTFELYYGFAKVGYGYLKVQPPVKYAVMADEGGKGVLKRVWHMAFTAEGFTGDWYKAIFAARDKVSAYSRPWNFGISRFWIKQNEEKPLFSSVNKEKWLEFNHYDCKVSERRKDYDDNKEENKEFELLPGAIDALGALFKLRTYDYRIGESVTFPVYTSEKNWLLEATPLEKGMVEVGAGKFSATKLNIKSYLGKELQQKGKMFFWIADKHPNRPVVKIEGKVSFGSIQILLQKFKAGR